MHRTMIVAAGMIIVAPAAAQSVKAGIDAWSRGDYAAAVAAWRPFAAKGNPDAMFDLGQAYRLGKGVPIDLAQAQGWYDRAARAGHIDAQTQLGMLLFQGGNRAAGLRWLKSAADRNEPRAQLLYGTALFNGDGIARDPVTAYRYVSKSAAQGLAPARTSLAELDATIPADVRQQAMAASAATPVAARPPNSKHPAKASAAIAKPPPVASPPSAPVTIATPAAGGWRVQLGAFSQRAGAEALFRKFAGGPLAGRQSYLVPIGAVTRLQAGPFAGKAEAAAACKALAVRGQACFPVPPAR